MDYKGYGIRVYWKDSDMGFRYTVFDKEVKIVAESEAAYFHSENAMAEARKVVDAMAGERA